MECGGLNITLTGDANDYVGKGMAGGKIIIKVPKILKELAKKMIIIGNTCIYGATGGKLFAEGIAGERFGVRNSGCTAIIEGSGDHTCEYMTGGSIIVLGKTGNNFGAGMTGGLSFVYDEDNTFAKKINTESVEIAKLSESMFIEHQKYLLKSLKEYYKDTGSYVAKSIILNFKEEINKFVIIKPRASDFKSLLVILTKAA